MNNPYDPPNARTRRVFKTSLITPLSVLVVVGIYAGYATLFARSEGEAVFPYLVTLSFPVFILSQVGLIASIVYNKKRIDEFLSLHPVIDSGLALERLKPIARTNMYSALFVFAFIALGALSAVATILNHGLIQAIIVVVVSIVTSRILKWYTSSEETLKQIDCEVEELEAELENVLACWQNRVLPNF